THRPYVSTCGSPWTQAVQYSERDEAWSHITIRSSRREPRVFVSLFCIVVLAFIAAAHLGVRAMRASHTLRWLAALLLGTALGVFLADANYWHPRNGVVLWILKVPTLYGI